MAIYRAIHTSFWQDDFVLRLTPEEKFFYLYLMTNTKTTQCGIYEMPKRIMMFETGYNEDTIDKLLKRFIEYEKIICSDETNEILIVNWLKYNPLKSPNILKCVSKEMELVKNDELIFYFNELNGTDYKGLIRGFIAPTKKEEQEEEETKEEEQEQIKEKDGFDIKNKVIRIQKKKDDIVYDQDITLDNAIKEYIQFRKEIKSPMTERAIQLMINKLNTLTEKSLNSKLEKIEILNQSILNGWKGIFPISKNNLNSNNKPNNFGFNKKEVSKPDWYGDYEKQLNGQAIDNKQDLSKEELQKLAKEING